MKITARALFLASALVGTYAVDDLTTVITGDQTVKETVCKGVVKDLLTCAASKEYVNDAWALVSTCLPQYRSTFEKCRGATLDYNDARDTGASQFDMARPAYAAAATVTKSLQIQGLVTIPAMDNKLRGVSCAICSKFTKKLLECALPATPTTGQSAPDALFDATAACLTTQWDLALYDLCASSQWELSPLTLDADGKLSYVLASPTLEINDVAETCPSVEARAKSNGAVYARIGKGHIVPYNP